MHVCPMVNPGPVPHVGGPVIKGQPNVLTGKMPQARVSDMCTCAGPPDTIVRGSSGVFVGGMPAARMGDNTSHGGVIVAGCPTVIIGETFAGRGGKGGAGGGGGVASGGGGGSNWGAFKPKGRTQTAQGSTRGGGGSPTQPADMGQSGAPATDKRCLAKAGKSGSAFVRVK